MRATSGEMLSTRDGSKAPCLQFLYIGLGWLLCWENSGISAPPLLGRLQPTATPFVATESGGRLLRPVNWGTRPRAAGVPPGGPGGRGSLSPHKASNKYLLHQREATPPHSLEVECHLFKFYFMWRKFWNSNSLLP